MKIEYSRRASNTDAFALIAEGWHEMVQTGLTPDGDAVCPVTSESEVLYAISAEEDVVGVIAWSSDDKTGVARVALAYVEPSSRRKGVFKALLAELTKCAAARHLDKIALTVGLANKDAQAMLRHMDRPPAALTFDLVV